MAKPLKIAFEDAHIIFRNFSGAEKPYNRAGQRNFNVIIDDPALAEKLIEDGWNIKPLKPREGDEDAAPRFRMEVKVAFENVPPKITLIAGKKKSILDEESVNVLDYAEILHVDLVVQAYSWNVNGKTGLKAYVKSMYVVIDQDEFAEKYDDVEHLEY